MSNQKIIDLYPSELLVFLSQAERDLLELVDENKLIIENGFCNETDLSEQNITYQIGEIYMRLRMMEHAFKKSNQDMRDCFTARGLPKVPSQIPVSVLDIHNKSIRKLMQDGILLLGDLYRDKMNLKVLNDIYDVNGYVQAFLNKSLKQIGLPALYNEYAHISAVLNILMMNKSEALQFSPDEADDHKALTLPDILIYRFHDTGYRSRLDGNEVHILETVVWGNMRPDDAVSGIDGLEVGALPFIIRLAGSKLIGDIHKI